MERRCRPELNARDGAEYYQGFVVEAVGTPVVGENGDDVKFLRLVPDRPGEREARSLCEMKEGGGGIVHEGAEGGWMPTGKPGGGYEGGGDVWWEPDIDRLGCRSPRTVTRREVVSYGYSREMEGNTHAEECAIKKFAETEEGKTWMARCRETEKSKTTEPSLSYELYTTMEPCTRRLSGLRDCTSRILEAGIDTIYYGTPEPKELVADCNGIVQLRRDGIRCIQVTHPILSRRVLNKPSSLNLSSPAHSLRWWMATS